MIKGEYISIETIKIMGAIEKENKELQQRIDKAIEIYEKRNTCEYKKKRFMEDKSTGGLMYEILKGERNGNSK